MCADGIHRHGRQAVVEPAMLLIVLCRFQFDCVTLNKLRSNGRTRDHSTIEFATDRRAGIPVVPR